VGIAGKGGFMRSCDTCANLNLYQVHPNARKLARNGTLCLPTIMYFWPSPGTRSHCL